MDLVPVPKPVAMVAAAALDSRAHRGGGGSARGIVIATALTTGWISRPEQTELVRWHAGHPDDVREGHSTLLGGLYGGHEARDHWCCPHTAAALNPEGKGAMIALPVPSEIADKVARPDGEPANAMHVTLFHLSNDATELDPALRETIGRAVASVVANVAGPAIEMSHVERFNAGDNRGPEGENLEPAVLTDGTAPVYELRQSLADVLDAADVPYSDDHGFRAHMTIGYYPEGDGPEAGVAPDPQRWTPDAVEVHWGDEVDRYLFGGEPMTAAAAPTANRLSRMSQRLNKTDRALVHRLHATANLALSEALRGAHVKLKTRARNRTKTQQAAIAAAERVTPAILAAVGVTENELLDHRFDTYGTTALAMIAASERRKLDAIATHLGVDRADLERDYGPTIDARAAAAAGFLVGALGELARAALAGTSLTSTGPGEYAGPVPFGLVRNAYDIITTGATPPPVDNTGVGPADIARLSEATSRRFATDSRTLVQQILDANDVRVQVRSTWVTGDPDRPFIPHNDLEGETWVDTMPDSLLADAGEFPYVDVYEPGDHDGCLCFIDTEYEPYEGDSTIIDEAASTLANTEQE